MQARNHTKSKLDMFLDANILSDERMLLGLNLMTGHVINDVTSHDPFWVFS
jgi:hypothetical protein